MKIDVHFILAVWQTVKSTKYNFIIILPSVCEMPMVPANGTVEM